jgi:hypothetical protein
VPNNLLEFARVARPTRKSDALLLAAQPERYVSQRILAHVEGLEGGEGSLYQNDGFGRFKPPHH